MTKGLFIKSLLTAGVLVAAQTAVNLSVAAQPATVITLTQTACQFVETENGVDHGFRSTKKADCKAINAGTSADRLAGAKVLELKPGKYIFRVTNKNVPYSLGFWLRGKGLGRITLPSVSGGGLAVGTTRDYAVDLKKGEYLYSCPLNPTPDYRLVVTG
ncbi:MAG: hypothetical protein ACE5FR_10665 [Rhodospirillales bacterium]